MAQRWRKFLLFNMSAISTTRPTFEIDATGEAIGRLATKIVEALQGKNHPGYTANMDNGDFVVVKNASKVKVTGKKLDQKQYYSYSGYPGGLAVKKLSTVMEKDPADAIRRAVSKMLPKNRLRQPRLKRLTVHN